MKIFHPKDSRGAIERFRLQHSWFDKITKENKRNTKQRRPEKISQIVVDRLAKALKNRDFREEDECVSAINEAIGDFNLNRK
jgi:hypothetical protein